jgi:hypothetical protein
VNRVGVTRLILLILTVWFIASPLRGTLVVFQWTPTRILLAEGILGPDRLSEALRGKVREMILTLAEAELREVLAVLPYERKGSVAGIATANRKDGSVWGWD